MRLYVGQSSFRGAIARYAQRFDIVEITAESGRLPRRSGLESWAKGVPTDFVFSVALPSAIASLETTATSDSLLAYSEQVADALGAGWWVLKTPASVTPSLASQRKLGALVERLKRPERRIAWEPRGVWSDSEAENVAETLGLFPVRDGTRQDLPDADVVYTRVRALGPGASVGLGAVELLAEQLQEREEAIVIIEGEGALRARESLHQLLDTDEEREEGE